MFHTSTRSLGRTIAVVLIVWLGLIARPGQRHRGR